LSTVMCFLFYCVFNWL